MTNPVKSDYSGYFIKEFGTQLLVGLLLSIILSLTVNLSMQRRLSLISLISICAVTGTYGQLMNWWELPTSYGLGVGLNLLIGWFFSSLIIIKFIIKSE